MVTSWPLCGTRTGCVSFKSPIFLQRFAVGVSAALYDLLNYAQIIDPVRGHYPRAPEQRPAGHKLLQLNPRSLRRFYHQVGVAFAQPGQRQPDTVLTRPQYAFAHRYVVRLAYPLDYVAAGADSGF